MYEEKEGGHLTLSLLPSSNMCISFVGDDGCTERLGLLNKNIESSEMVIDEISADGSGCSFLLKFPGSQVLYFWCSEKSKDHGMELLAKGYLVSAGPAISSAIPPLLSSFVNRPLIPNTESAVEKSAWETLRMLMASTPISSCQKPTIVLPKIDRVDENSLGFPRSNHDAAAAVSQGIYSGIFIEDVEAVAAGLFSMGLSS